MKIQREYPIIIIGMHRSGSSMLTRILEQLGLFVGAEKEYNHEAIFFLKLNHRILESCRGQAENPSPIRNKLKDKKFVKKWTDLIRSQIDSRRIKSFFGSDLYSKYRSIENLDIQWGWKDPRNTFTLPLWLKIFPNAKVIHIYRHGVDVANSLKVRRKVWKKHPVRFFRHNRHFLTLTTIIRNVGKPSRSSTLEGGFSLWEEYIKEARKHMLNLKDRAMEVKYEDFFTDPYRILRSLTTFSGLSVSENDLQKVTESLVEDRRFAYRKNPELLIFAKNMADRLKVYGY